MAPGDDMSGDLDPVPHQARVALGKRPGSAPVVGVPG